jgi:hypothetical protein
MRMASRHFSQDEIYLSSDDAYTVLRFLLPASQFAKSDRAFPQALLLEAIDKSYAMGYVQEIFEVFYVKVPWSSKV